MVNSFRLLFNRGQSTWNTFDDDSEEMKQYLALSPEYQKILAPYLQYSYKPGLFDQLFNHLGRTGIDRAREQAQALFREKLSGLSSEVQQNTMNAPVNQASRMRDAGQNPDLLGTGDVASASEQDQPSSVSAMDILPDINTDYNANLMNDLEGAFNMMLGAVRTQDVLSQIHLRNLSVESQDITNSDDMMKYIVSKYSHIEPKQLQNAFESGLLQFGDLPEYSAIQPDGSFNGGTLDSSVNVAPMPTEFQTPEAEKRFKYLLNQLKNNPQSRDAFYKAQADMFNSRRQSQIGKANKLTMEDEQAVNDVNIRFLADCAELKQKYQAKVDWVLLKLQQAKAGNEQVTQELIAKYKLPEELVGADLQQAIARKLQAEYDQEFAKKQREHLNELHAKYLKGNTWAGYVYQYKLNQMPMPNFQQAATYGIMNVADNAAEGIQNFDSADVWKQMFGFN